VVIKNPSKYGLSPNTELLKTLNHLGKPKGASASTLWKKLPEVIKDNDQFGTVNPN